MSGQPRFNQSLQRRIAIIFTLVVLTLVLLAGRLFWIQYIKGQTLNALALKNRVHSITVPAKRGAIYDRNYQELAISIDTESVFVSPQEIAKAGQQKETARTLARILGMDENAVYKKITGDSSFAWVKRQVDLDTSKKLKSLKIKGVYTVKESRRFYPEKELACHVLGICGIDNVGLEGIDYYYNDLLSGTPGVLVAETDRLGNPIPETVHYSVPAKDGKNLVLTIDENIQHVAEQQAAKIWKDRSPDSVSILVMDPRTGEILALANQPNFDPNHYNDYPIQARRNFAVNNALEPGSTGKIITAAAALEEGIVHPGDHFSCPGSIKVQDRVIHEAHGEAFGNLTFEGLMEKSSNVGFVQVGLKLGLTRYFRYARAFGLGQKTGIDLPGESPGILVPEKTARQIDLATMAFGQANAITPIQLITAVSAVANGGKMMKPHLLKEVTDDQGRVVQRIEPQVVRDVISEDTARQLRLILEKVVKEGTGENAYIAGYRVGGKTGTAQKIAPGGGYLPNSYVTSFIAMAPVNDPRLVTLVVVDNPKGTNIFGATTAAPAARAILEYSLPYLGVLKQGQVASSTDKQTDNTEIVPDLVGLTPAQAFKAAGSHHLQLRLIGKGTWVWDQSPIAFTPVKPGSTVEVRLAESVSKQSTPLVPELRGKSMREAADLLKASGLVLRPEGSGLAAEQDPAPGTRVPRQSEVRVIFKPLQP